jgi:hypothetical protein
MVKEAEDEETEVYEVEIPASPHVSWPSLMEMDMEKPHPVRLALRVSPVDARV